MYNKKLLYLKLTAHIDIKGNEEADKSAKQTIDMPRMTIKRLPCTDFYLPSEELETGGVGECP